MRTTDIVHLGRIYATATGLRLTTVGRHIAQHGAFFARLDAGRDITTRRADRVVQRLSDLWPAGAVWPSDIPRPAPSGGDSNPPAGGRSSSAVSRAPALPGAGVLAREGSLSARPATSLKRLSSGARSRRKAAASAGRAAPSRTEAA